LVLAIESEARVVYLDDTGAIVGAVGQKGDGPGEFTSLTRLFVNGDEVMIWDGSNQRLSILSLPMYHQVVGVFTDGQLVSSPSATAVPTRALQGNVGLKEGEIRPYIVWDKEGRQTDTISGGTEFPAPVVTFELLSEGQTRTVTTNLGTSCLPAWRHLVRENEIITANSRDGQVLVIERMGIPSTIFVHQPDTIGLEVLNDTNAMVGRMEERGRLSDSSKEALLARIGQVGDRVPSYWSDMLVEQGAEPRIWLRRASCFSSEPDDVWEVISYRGQLDAQVTIPKSVRILAVRNDHLLGVVTDSLGVEAVALFNVIPRAR
jgi:hypothetical protein